MSRRAIDESDRDLAKSRGGDGVPTRIWAFASGREPEDEGLPQLDLFPLRLRGWLDPVRWGRELRWRGKGRWVEGARREARWERSGLVGAFFEGGRARAMGRCRGRDRLEGCGGAHVKYGGYSKKSGKAKAPAILAAPSSLGSASGCVVPS